MTVFAPGSIALRIYPHEELTAPDMVTEMRAQARLAVEHGFDGVMLAEHHGGFTGYLPNPLQVASWLLDAMPAGWAAPCPMLLPLRPAMLVAEEVAWLAARFPGRVGVGVAAGALADDFEVLDVSRADLTARFAAGLAGLAAALRGGAGGALSRDAAIARCAAEPVPVVSGAMSLTAARRAARLRVGLIFDAITAPARLRQLTDAYRETGGTGPLCFMREVWLGAKPEDLFERQVAVYKTFAATTTVAHWQANQTIAAPDGDEIADRVAAGIRTSGTDSVNLRVHVAGVTPEMAREQIIRLGAEVLPRLRRAIAPGKATPDLPAGHTGTT